MSYLNRLKSRYEESSRYKNPRDKKYIKEEISINNRYFFKPLDEGTGTTTIHRTSRVDYDQEFLEFFAEMRSFYSKELKVNPDVDYDMENEYSENDI